MSFSAVHLSDVCSFVMGQSPPSSSYNTVGNGVPFFQGKTDFGEMYPSSRVYCSAPLRLGEAGDILISVRAPVGPTNVVRDRCCIGRGLAALKAGTQLDQQYLLYFLRHHEPRLAQLGQGSTFEAINRDDLEDVQIPMRSMSEQHRIAAQLEQADRLRRTRRYTLELSDSFLPATFLRMLANGADLRRFSVEELLASTPNAMRTGPFGSQLLHAVFTDSGIAVLGIDNAVNNAFEWSQRRYISSKKYEQLRRYTVKSGDVIITLMGTCGRCAIVPDDIPTAINTKHLCCITLDKTRCLPAYLHAAFLYHPEVQHQLGISQKGAIMDGLNMEIIKNLRIPLPAIEQQRHFATLVAQHERLRATQRESLRQAEHLFQPLLHRAFSPD